jgi:SAM-dependent methyltransferase
MSVVDDYQPAAWEAGPAAVIYDALAEVAFDHCPVSLDGASVLDAGAGTGAASKAARGRGARVTASDISAPMLAFHRDRRPPGAAADTRALPFRDAAFDVVAVPFSLSHVNPPVAGLREVRRVTRPGGTVVVSGFGSTDRHPVKVVVQELLEARGWTPPPWYTHLKDEVEPVLADPAALEELAGDAGFVTADACLVDVDLGLRSSRQMAQYRLGMSQVAAFVSRLGPVAAAELEDEVVARLPDTPAPFALQLALLVARA